MDLEVVPVVDDLLDHVVHVVRAVRVGRHQVEQGLGAPVHGVVDGLGGREFAVVGRQHREQVPDVLEGGLLVVVGVVGHSGGLGVHVGAAQAVLGDLLAGDGLHHVRAGDEHLRGAAHHEDEVGERGRVRRAARAGAHDDADLRQDTGVADVALEDAAVAGERRDALLDAGAGAVAQAHDGRAGGLGEVHQLVDLLGVGLAEGAAEDAEVVGVGEDRTALHLAPAGDDAVGVRLLVLEAEAGGAVPTEGLGLGERALVEEEFQALAGGELALGLLGLGGPGARTREDLLAQVRQLGHASAHARRHRGRGNGRRGRGGRSGRGRGPVARLPRGRPGR